METLSTFYSNVKFFLLFLKNNKTHYQKNLLYQVVRRLLVAFAYFIFRI